MSSVINHLRAQLLVLFKMKSLVTLVLLLRFLAFYAFAEEDNALNFIPINVLNITVKNGSMVYPDILILLPQDFSAEQRAEFMDQLAAGLVGDVIETTDNTLGEDTDADVNRGVDAALQEAARQIVSLNTTSANLAESRATKGTKDNLSHQIYAVIPSVEEEYIRRRRSLKRLAPLVRNKRTLKKKSKGSCMVCQMLQPKQPMVINVYKQDGCGGGCGQHYQPPSCGQPQCGYNPQPRPQPPPVYHPPPQQTCDPCSRQPANHQPSYQQPAYHEPASNSYSYSQASSSSSSGSYNWGQKK